MEHVNDKRPIATVAGLAALFLWCVYLLLALASIPDIPYRMMINGFFGVLAGVAVIAGYRHWRAAVVLASFVYLAVYAVQLVRMTGMMAGSDMPLSSALSYYYGASWTVASGVFLERGMAAGLAHGFLEYAMPVLVVLVLGLSLLNRR